jgi:acetaldehyde dehydrogenase / alcohol dehydrogenase
VHTDSDELIARFATALPVSRLLVNSPAGLACVGIGNGLAPSFMLGCGTFGGTSTTDNVTYRNLLNIKRIARPCNEAWDTGTPHNRERLRVMSSPCRTT